MKKRPLKILNFRLHNRGQDLPTAQMGQPSDGHEVMLNY